MNCFLATERTLSLEEFLQRLLEQPVGQHYHSVSINKHQLVERYDEAVRDLIHRYPSFSGNTNEQQQQQSPTRSNRTSVSIPVVIHHHHQQPQQPQQQQINPIPETIPAVDPRGSSPMQQGDDDQDPPLPPSTS